MKKLLCVLLALMMICSFAMAEDTVKLGFEEGFKLELPLGWLRYIPDDEMKNQNVLYCLSDAEGKCWLYIQSWESECANVDALLEMVNSGAEPASSGKYNFNGSEFVVYDLEEGDVSCCATIMDGKILNFVFTPQSDAEFMATAAQVIGSYDLI